MTLTSRPSWTSAALASVFVATTASLSPGSGGGAAGQPPTGNPAAIMRGHFGDAIRVHEAIVLGDLNATREPARRLAAYPADAWPVEGRRYVAGLASAAAQVSNAAEFAAAAAGTSSMLLACGDCHRATGHTPAPADVFWRADRGGPAGMLEHEAAAGELFRGLVIPSDAAWRDGAARLRTAPLFNPGASRDPRSTQKIADHEKQLRRTAERAAGAGNRIQRARAYAELITQCAACHSLRSDVR